MGHDFGRAGASPRRTHHARNAHHRSREERQPHSRRLGAGRGRPSTTDASAALMAPSCRWPATKATHWRSCGGSLQRPERIGRRPGHRFDYKQPEKPQDAGHFFFLLDIEGFMDVGLFKHRIDAMVRQIKSCRTKPGVEEIRVPGEHSFRQRQENLAQGIPLDATTVSDLRRLCAELRVDPENHRVSFQANNRCARLQPQQPASIAVNRMLTQTYHASYALR